MLRVLHAWFLGLCLAASLALAEPPQGSATYLEASAGLLSLADGAIVEGSTRHGGLQPDYRIDYAHPHMQRLLKYAERVGRKDLLPWEKIGKIQQYIRRNLPHDDYDSPEYLKLMKKYRRKGEAVPLGEYLAVKSGVCREFALLTHVALTAAGIDNLYGYVQVDQGGKVEDHAFCVVRYLGEAWVVDTYNSNFDGYRLSALLRGNRLGQSRAGWEPEETRRRVLGIRPFPKLWYPPERPPMRACPRLWRALKDTLGP